VRDFNRTSASETNLPMVASSLKAGKNTLMLAGFRDIIYFS